MLRTGTILFMFLMSATALAAGGAMIGVGAGNGFGGGANPVAPADPAAGPQKPMEMAFEPWVKTAAVGDFIVMKFKGGHTLRKEVKSVEDDFVTVETKSDSRPGQMKYHRKESAGPNVVKVGVADLDMKLTKTDTVTINGQKIACEQWDGFRRTFSLSTKAGERVKLTKYQKLCAAGVPFGGVIREMMAPDDGKAMTLNGPARIINQNNTLDIIYEVTDFGTGKDAQKK